MTMNNPDTLTVSDLMTPGPITVSPSAQVDEARSLLSERRIRHLPVTDADGRVVGLITKRDLEGFSARGGEATKSVAFIMVKDVDTAGAGDPIGAAARHMFQTKRGCLPVLDNDKKIVGILTEADFLRWFVRNTSV